MERAAFRQPSPMSPVLRRRASRVCLLLGCAGFLAASVAAAKSPNEPVSEQQPKARVGCPLHGSAASGPRDDRRPPPGAPNVLLIVVDTLRADHLGSYRRTHRPGRAATPNIDRLAAEAWVYERAVAPAPWTAPSFAGLLTGRSPGGLGIGAEPRSLPEQVPTLAEQLADLGYVNAGVVSHFLIGTKFGFDRGFHYWDQRNAGGHTAVSTDGVTDLAEACLDEVASLKRPFFLFAHYFDPHYDYLAHPEFPFYEGYSGSLRSRDDNFARLRALAKKGRLEPRDFQYLKDLYDSEIAYTDAGIGRLLAALGRRGLYEKTLIVLVADHGEMFGERPGRWIGHTKYLFEELIRVPLLIKPPSRSPGPSGKGRLESTVSLIDLVPTILEVIEPGAPAEGSLLPRRGEKELANRLVFSQTRRWRSLDAVYDGDWKLVVDRETGRTLLYDLARDPGEQQNVWQDHPERSRELKRHLDLWSKSQDLLAVEFTGEATPELSEEEIEAMRSLGYIH